MAQSLTRLSPGLYRNQQGAIVRSPTGAAPNRQARRDPRAAIRRQDVQNQRGLGQLEGGSIDLSQTATELANDRVTNTLNNPYAPPEAVRAMPEDVLAAQKQAEDEAYSYLTRDFEKQQGLANEQADQSLANRGIPYSDDPNSRYQQEKRDIVNRFDEARLEARQSAGAEGRAARESLFAQQEKLAADKEATALATRGQNLAETEAFSQLGVPQTVALENTNLKRKELRQRGRLTRAEIRARERLARLQNRGGVADPNADLDGDGLPG